MVGAEFSAVAGLSGSGRLRLHCIEQTEHGSEGGRAVNQGHSTGYCSGEPGLRAQGPWRTLMIFQGRRERVSVQPLLLEDGSHGLRNFLRVKLKLSSF